LQAHVSYPGTRYRSTGKTDRMVGHKAKRTLTSGPTHLCESELARLSYNLEKIEKCGFR
jgi:hypothetical protein